MQGTKFEKGMFLTKPSEKGSFYIYEGIDVSIYSYSKKYTVVAAYDPHKYCRENDTTYAYTYKAVLSCATNQERCSETISYDSESTWIRICTEEEKQEALEVLHSYGYDWSDELLSLIDMESGEIIRKIPQPCNEYNGNIIQPISGDNEQLLYEYVMSNNTPPTNYSHSPSYSYGGYNYGQYSDYDFYYD